MGAGGGGSHVSAAKRAQKGEKTEWKYFGRHNSLKKKKTTARLPRARRQETGACTHTLPTPQLYPSMSDDEGAAGGRRPKRRCARRATANEALYVGYVEDNETPEMIMKKFEALEKVRVLCGKRRRRGGRRVFFWADVFFFNCARASLPASPPASFLISPPRPAAKRRVTTPSRRLPVVEPQSQLPC